MYVQNLSKLKFNQPIIDICTLKYCKLHGLAYIIFPSLLHFNHKLYEYWTTK